MRIAVLVIGLVLGVIAFFQITLVGNLSDWANDQSAETAAALGFGGLVLWLVAIALVIPWPRVAMLLFAFAGGLTFLGASDFPDLGVWGTVAMFLALLSYLGSRQKRKSDAKEAERDLLMQQMVQYQATIAGAQSASQEES